MRGEPATRDEIYRAFSRYYRGTPAAMEKKWRHSTSTVALSQSTSAPTCCRSSGTGTFIFGIVKQNNGFLSVYSEPGLGATFRIYLPRFAGGDPAGSAGPAIEELARGKGHILVVENDEILRCVIPEILAQLGYPLTLAETSEKALQICREPGGAIDVLLTDVVMPGMSGKELWEKVRYVRPELKVIYMSGYTADVISRQGILESGVCFIQKPFTAA